jgi:hypothetical protein
VRVRVTGAGRAYEGEVEWPLVRGAEFKFRTEGGELTTGVVDEVLPGGYFRTAQGKFHLEVLDLRYLRGGQA